MKRVLAIVVIVATPITASAAPEPNAPSALGLGVGVASDIGPSGEAVPVVSVFGRIGIAPRFALQAELDKTYPDSFQVDDRSFTLLGTFDLIDLFGTKQLVPMLLAGAGLDWSHGTYNNTNGQHVEAGAAFEYRVNGGLMIGIDVRVGYRNASSPPAVVEPTDGGGLAPPIVPPIDPPIDPSEDVSVMSSGSYMNARLYAAIHF